MKVCQGLAASSNTFLTSHESSSDTAGYLLKHWDKCRGLWRSKSCSLFLQEEERPSTNDAAGSPYEPMERNAAAIRAGSCVAIAGPSRPITSPSDGKPGADWATPRQPKTRISATFNRDWNIFLGLTAGGSYSFDACQSKMVSIRGRLVP